MFPWEQRAPPFRDVAVTLLVLVPLLLEIQNKACVSSTKADIVQTYGFYRRSTTDSPLSKARLMHSCSLLGAILNQYTLSVNLSG